MGGFAGAAVQSMSSMFQEGVGHNAIGKAGQAQMNGYENAQNILTSQYGKTQGYLDPYSKEGQAALGQLSELARNWKDFDSSQMDDDSGYQFRQAEGQKALERSAAARGSSLSGGQLKSLAQYGQGLASQEYQNAYNRYMNNNSQRFGQLSGLANMGLNASSQQANYSNQYGSNLAGLTLDKANARAANTMAQFRLFQSQDSKAAGAWSSALNSYGFGK